MMDIIRCRENQNFHREIFYRFMKEVTNQAENFQVEQRAAPSSQIEIDKEIKKWKINNTFRKHKLRYELHLPKHHNHKKPETETRGINREWCRWTAIVLKSKCRSQGKNINWANAIYAIRTVTPSQAKNIVGQREHGSENKVEETVK